MEVRSEKNNAHELLRKLFLITASWGKWSLEIQIDERSP